MDAEVKQIAEHYLHWHGTACKCFQCALSRAYLDKCHDHDRINEMCARRPALADCTTLPEKVGTALAACATMDREVHDLRHKNKCLHADLARLRGVLRETEEWIRVASGGGETEFRAKLQAALAGEATTKEADNG